MLDTPAIRETQVKTTSYDLTPIRLALPLHTHLPHRKRVLLGVWDIGTLVHPPLVGT